MTAPAEIWMPVRIPKPRFQHPGASAENLQKMRDAAASAHRLQTRAKRQVLLDFLKSPSDDFDGTNAKLAEYLGMSVRTVIRLLRGLETEGSLKVKRTNMRTPKGFVTRREIQVVRAA